MLRMVEEATHAGYPMDAGAVLLIELEGLGEVVEEQVAQIREACMLCGARDFSRGAHGRRARPAVERPQERVRRGGTREPHLLCAGRSGAAHQDCADRLHFIGETARKYGLTISNIFHAGDGNMHPIILSTRAKRAIWNGASAARRFETYCIEAGGSITGEHGVGMEKNELMSKLFQPETLEMMGKLKALFDPGNRLNPGKVLPTGRGCLEIRQQPLAYGPGFVLTVCPDAVHSEVERGAGRVLAPRGQSRPEADGFGRLLVMVRRDLCLRRSIMESCRVFGPFSSYTVILFPYINLRLNPHRRVQYKSPYRQCPAPAAITST